MSPDYSRAKCWYKWFGYFWFKYSCFLFCRFLPKNINKERQQFFKELALIDSTLIFYVTPHNLSKDLEIILKVIGNRKGALLRELTKKFEEVKRGTIAELLTWSTLKNQGEKCFFMLLEVKMK